MYATNKCLFNTQLVRHNTCSFCDDAVETIFHLFWQCPTTQIFIKEVLSHIRAKYNAAINITPVSWFLLTDLTDIEVIVVTISKVSIHNSRLKAARPSVEETMQCLRLEAVKEINIAKSNDKVREFEQKWGKLKRITDQ